MSTITAIDKRYLVQEKLGEGGMGVVYRAIDRLTGQAVALKRILAPTQQLTFNTMMNESNDSKVALAREFQTLSSLAPLL